MVNKFNAQCNDWPVRVFLPVDWTQENKTTIKFLGKIQVVKFLLSMIK